MMTLVYKYEILFHAKLIDNEANKLTKKKERETEAVSEGERLKIKGMNVRRLHTMY